MPPQALLDAIDAVSGTLPCLEECMSVGLELRYAPAQDEIRIRHPEPQCECVRHQDGKAALALAHYVRERLAEYCFIADYGDMPVSVAG